MTHTDPARRPRGRGALARTAATGVTAAVLTLAWAAPALAVTREDGDEPGPGLQLSSSLLYYVAVPVVAYLVIHLVVYVMARVRGNHYLAGRAWNAQPIWVGGPDAPVAALESTGQRSASTEVATTTTTRGGGARARW